MTNLTDTDYDFLHDAFNQARLGYDEGGVPVGAVMTRNNKLIAAGRNRRVQEDDPVLHGETDCLRQAGILDNYDDVVMYTTLSPCMMCTGAIIKFGIKRVVVGENINFKGNIEFLQNHGVEVILADSHECKILMSQFIQERPDIWFEDIAGREDIPTIDSQ